MGRKKMYRMAVALALAAAWNSGARGYEAWELEQLLMEKSAGRDLAVAMPSGEIDFDLLLKIAQEQQEENRRAQSEPGYAAASEDAGEFYDQMPSTESFQPEYLRKLNSASKGGEYDLASAQNKKGYSGSFTAKMMQAAQSETLVPQAGAGGWRGAENIVSAGLRLMGVKYRWGGEDPLMGLDCSGFVRYTAKRVLGLDLPRTAREQSNVGMRVDRSLLRPGDLVFFGNRYGIKHVGIYVGADLFVHAPRTGSNVRLDDLTGNYWRSRFMMAKRLAEGGNG